MERKNLIKPKKWQRNLMKKPWPENAFLKFWHNFPCSIIHELHTFILLHNITFMAFSFSPLLANIQMAFNATLNLKLKNACKLQHNQLNLTFTKFPFGNAFLSFLFTYGMWLFASQCINMQVSYCLNKCTNTFLNFVAHEI